MKLIFVILGIIVISIQFIWFGIEVHYENKSYKETKKKNKILEDYKDDSNK